MRSQPIKFAGKKTELVSLTTVNIRFSETDPLGIVWHGHYAQYFEDGREDFGKKFGLGYLDIHKEHYLVPVVELTCKYKKQLRYGDVALVETRYINCESAKLIFEYKLYRNTQSEKNLVAEGRSIQVFLNEERELMLVHPPFYIRWRERWLSPARQT
jgi:acyl-CoA thioester hydrolase